MGGDTGCRRPTPTPCITHMGLLGALKPWGSGQASSSAQLKIQSWSQAGTKLEPTWAKPWG